MDKAFKTFAIVSRFLIYTVIVAGSIVRMTGSGMGCPDWPQCFGSIIPPTSEKEVKFQPINQYHEDQIIIHDEKIWIATEDFTSGVEFSEKNWMIYPKHSYAKFTVFNTWIEFVNRLATVLLGFPVIGAFVVSFFAAKRRKKKIIFSALLLILIGVEAWLGRTVVDSALLSSKITIHLILAFCLVPIVHYMCLLTRRGILFDNYQFTTKFQYLLVAFTLVFVVQFGIGVQVREFVDVQMEHNFLDKKSWLMDAPWSFIVHRSFSIITVAVMLGLVYRNKKDGLNLNNITNLFFLLISAIAMGISMYYLDFPLFSQPLHLLVSALILGQISELWFKKISSSKTLV